MTSNTISHGRTNAGNLGFEWVFGKQAKFTELNLQLDGDERSIKFQIGLHWLFWFVVTFHTRLVPGYNGNIDDMHREIGVAWHNGYAWLCLWHNYMGSRPDRCYAFSPADFIAGDLTYSTRTLGGAVWFPVEFPEGTYDVRATMKQATRQRKRLPFIGEVYYIVDMDCGDGIPVPGKCECGWDCGENAVMGFSARAESFEDALDQLKESVLTTRERYGGENWLPEQPND